MRNYGGAILTFTPFIVVILHSFHKLLMNLKNLTVSNKYNRRFGQANEKKSIILQCDNPFASSMCLLSLLNEEMIENGQLYGDYNYYTTVQYGESPHLKGCRL